MIYDLIIIGGSAAATTAGIYAARRGLNFKIITKEFGGEVATSGEIGNWPGDSNTDGITLAAKFKEHLQSLKANVEEGVAVEKITKIEDGTFEIVSEDKTYQAKAVIITTGVHPKELNVPGEKEFRNRGVTYCTVCDGPLYIGKVTVVIGGGNAALEAGLMLADIASKVYMVNKNSQFKGDKILLDNLMTKKNVEIIYGAMTTKILGDGMVTGIEYNKDGQSQQLQIDGVFIHIGQLPNSGIAPAEVEKDNFNQIKVNTNCETNVPGLYAAGDVTDVSFKQIVIAAGQGCVAALSVVQYLNRK